MRVVQDVMVKGNFAALMRCNGKVVPGSMREGHNIFTITGRNFLSKLVAWQTIGGTDVPFTNRRVRWIGIGIGSQLESPTVSALAQPALVSTNSYLAPIQGVEFPSSTSVRFIREFSLSEVTVTNLPVSITEAGLFADVNPASQDSATDGVEDVPADEGTVNTILNPTSASNSPVAYKSFEPITKTIDFTLEIKWDFRFE